MKIEKQIIFLAVIAFVPHLVWENAQAPLFQGYGSFGAHFPMCVLGAVGDVILTLFVWTVVSLFKNSFDWIAALNKKDLAALTVIGFFAAVGIEQNALLLGKWAYTHSMPLLPYFKVGLWPILQMTLLLPLSIFIAGQFFHRKPFVISDSQK